jgi:dihydropteroate synthase
MKSTSMQCGRYRLPLFYPTASTVPARPLVMGILNVTPDSFSDGGRFQALELAVSHAEQMIAEGVDIIDIGGESSRPGVEPLPLEEELRRVMPVIYALRDCGKPLSIDTYKPEVMREAIAADVDMINDIHGFRMSGALESVADSSCALCIMHMQGDPQSMQRDPHYQDVVGNVTAFLHERVEAAQKLGVAKDRICIDPGFGFGKSLGHNLALLRHLGQIQQELGMPLLAGMSRKSMIGGITGKPIEARLAGSLAAALAATAQGAQILRVHDVAETVDALKVWHAATSASQ